MNHRTNAVWFFLLFLLAGVIALQILSMIRSDRLYVALNKIERSIEGDNSQAKLNTASKISQPADETYPGDDGNWLIWAMLVEPKTLNQINVGQAIFILDGLHV